MNNQAEQPKEGTAMNETTDQNESKSTAIILPPEKKAQPLVTTGDSQAQSLIQVIERVAMNPNADIVKLEKLMDLQERIMNREEEKAFYADLATMQPELPRVIKSKDGHNSKYAPLEDINDAIRPAMQKHGFAVFFDINQGDKCVEITTTLAHRLGHTKSLTIPLALDTSGSKNAVQAVGSTISYGKRYGICAILNISTGDDTDGNQSQDKETESNTITEDQVKELETLIAKSSTTAESVCTQAGISQLSELRTEHFGPAKQHIRSCTEAAQ